MKILRPHFPEGYITSTTSLLAWEVVEESLRTAHNYWVCTVRPNGHPHVIPKWGVWVAGRFYFDGSPQTRHARNLAQNPSVSVHLESGDQVVIVEGVGRALDRPEAGTAEAVAAEYRRKYAQDGYAPQPDQWDKGGLFVVVPKTVLAWTQFTKDPTKFILE
jgi:nitroimidazol reductase NimA-like FMN-containing flavoprotein (pyridoxamine 5'-phosphate oxidase superfamily)